LASLRAERRSGGSSPRRRFSDLRRADEAAATVDTNRLRAVLGCV